MMVSFFVAGKTYAQDFVYTPKNPAFGGSFYNYNWLLSSAETQNDITEKTTDPFSGYQTDPLKDFTESLNRQILSQLSRQIVTNQFGEDALSTGTYILGNYQIDIGDQGSGLNITITDASTGTQTTVEVPYF